MMTSESRPTSVQVTLPASTGSVRLARVVAATLADEAGFDYDRVEDVRVAVDELCFSVISDLSDGELRLDFDVRDGRLLVTGEVRGASPSEGAEGVDAASADLVEQILGAIADEHGVDLVDGSPRFRLVMSP